MERLRQEIDERTRRYAELAGRRPAVEALFAQRDTIPEREDRDDAGEAGR
jgi:hypothetical protein